MRHIFITVVQTMTYHLLEIAIQSMKKTWNIAQYFFTYFSDLKLGYFILWIPDNDQTVLAVDVAQWYEMVKDLWDRDSDQLYWFFYD